MATNKVHAAEANTSICCYTVIIHTGCTFPGLTEINAWHDGTMLLTINPGSPDNESEELQLKEHFPDDTEGTVIKDYWLSQSIGVPKLIKVDLQSNRSEVKKDALYVREVTIMYDRQPYRFPIKNYVYPHNPVRGNPTIAEMGCPPHFLVREGAGTIKSLETEEYLLKARKEDLDTIQTMVAWHEHQDTELLYPGYLSTMEYEKLPRFLKFKDARLDAFLNFRKMGQKKILRYVLENCIGKICGTYKEERFTSFEECAEFVKNKSDEMGWSKEIIQEAIRVSQIFKEDLEFGRQMLCGPNALKITKVKTLDGRWVEGKDKVPEYALEGKSVDAALESGRLYEVTQDDLIGIPHGGVFSKKLTGTSQTWYVVLADCLLYVRDDDTIVPVLIRLENRIDEEPATYWVPPKPGTDENDSTYLAWLLAKMYFRCADLNTYSLSTHYARAHAVSEVFAVGMYRNLPNAHPIFRLLQPHLQGIIGINVQARAVLVNPGKNAMAFFISAGDNLAKVLNNYYKGFSYETLLVPADIEKRDVSDLPGYLYRDDIMEHWNLILDYTNKVVNLTYQTDEALINDDEIQKMIKEIAEKGFRGYPKNAGFPKSLSSRAKLAEYLTAIIVNISIFHTAVNFQTFTSYGFSPNAPSCVTKPPPTQDETITMDRIFATLPVKEIAFISMNVSYNLGQYSPIEKFYLASEGENKMGMIGENMMVSPEQEMCIRELIAGMRCLKDKIDSRNENLYLKYDVMSPNNVPLTTQT